MTTLLNGHTNTMSMPGAVLLGQPRQPELVIEPAPVPVPVEAPVVDAVPPALAPVVAPVESPSRWRLWRGKKNRSAPPARPIAPVVEAAPAVPVVNATPKRVSARKQRRAERLARMQAAGVEPLGFWGRLGAVAVAVGALGIGAIGFVASFANVEDQMVPAFGSDSAWLVPAGIDLGIAVFIGLDILLAKRRMRLSWLRFIPWGLTAVTIGLNAAGHGGVGLIAHVTLPALFIVVAEVIAHVVRVLAGIAAGEVREGIRLPRWVVAPAETVRLWVIMARDSDVETYADALVIYKRRVLAGAALRGVYGVAWRVKAPLELRTQHRLGDLTAADVRPIDAATAKPTKAIKPVPAKAPKPAKPTKSARSDVSDADLLARINELPQDADGHVAVKAVRKATGIGVDRARRLLDEAGLLKPKTA
ncbi:DUF2637 domain-containing protein [Stackebrandtia soli]|uniref:DUF2637 domain-containing protein n=1 Tax=Stackebrandtia soli TaxID=1892856 RepID=UPI0039E83DA6